MNNKTMKKIDMKTFITTHDNDVTLCSQAWWHTSVIPATQEAEEGECQVPSQPRQN
jgi:hypothetical protein